MSPQPLPSAVAIRRVPGLPHPMSLPRRGLTLYWVALSAVPSPRWRADFLWPPPVLRTATYTPAVGRLGLPGARIIFRTSPSRLRHWVRRIDRWIADANSVVEE